MIRGVLKKGRIQPIDKLPKDWAEGQELLIDAAAPSDDPEEIKRWYAELQTLSAQIPRDDHRRMAEALAQHGARGEGTRAARNGAVNDMVAYLLDTNHLGMPWIGRPAAVRRCESFTSAFSCRL